MCDLHRDEDLATPRGGITALVDELTVALTNWRIYSKEHPRVRSSIASLHRSVNALLKDDGSDAVVLGSAEGLLFYKNKALLRASLSSTRMIDALKACKAGGVSIDKAAGEADLMALVDLVATSKKSAESVQDANADLVQRGSQFIRFLPEYRLGNGEPGSETSAPLQESIPFDVPRELYQRTVGLLQDSAVRVCHGDDIDLDDVRGFVEAILQRLAQDGGSMLGLARYERYDAYTFGHSIRVCFLALNFAAALFRDEELLLRIGLAALLHDIGKARVPFEVLHSTSKLTPEERVEMNKHPIHGAEILLGLSEIDPLAVATAFSHHQTVSGAGYPATIHRVGPSIGTRLVKICDVYEALTAVRPYKPRMSPVRAYRVMISMKDHFDSALLRRFIDVNGIYPVGSLVNLSTGERGRVVRQGSNPMAPVVRTEVGGQGAAIGHDPGAIVDLSAANDGTGPRVLGIVDDAA